MYTLEEIDAEIARRQSTSRAATPKVASPQGGSAAPAPSVANLMDAARLAGPDAPRPEAQDVVQNTARSGLRGMTLGASDAIGAGVATAMALPQALRQQAERQRSEGLEPDLIDAFKRGVPETYRDIRGTLQMEEDNFAEAAPELSRGAEIAGAGVSMLAAGAPLLRAAAGPLKRATAGALSRGAARVGGSGAKPAAGARAASSTKPRFRMDADGNPVPMNKAASKILKKATRRKSVKDGATLGAEVDLVESVLSDEHVPGNTVAGAAAGLAFPKALQKLLTNTPLGRMVYTKALSKIIGQKYQPYIYVGGHPTTRKALEEVIKTGVR